MGPINYAIDVQSPFQSALQGFQAGAGVRQAIDQRADAERQRQAQQQMQLDLSELSRNPTPRAIASMSVKYPQLSENFKRSFDMMDAEQRQRRLGQATSVYAALQSKRPDVAIKLLRDQAAAMRNGGAEDEAKGSDMLASLIETSPETAMVSAGTLLSAAMGADKFAETFGKLGAEQRAQELQPSAVREAEAKATGAEADTQTKQTTAKYAEQNALADLEKKGWDIKAIQSDITYKREQNRIAAMNAAANREGNDLKRQELKLKIQEAQQKLDDKVREKVATAEAGASSIDNMLNTVERIKTNKSLNDVLGSVEGRMPAAASMLDDEESDAIALIETLGSQAFLAQIPNIKGMGALSNAEGEKLQSALQSLSRAQSEKQFRANLDEAARLLKKGRESLSRSTGVPLGKPDTPAAPGDAWAAGGKPKPAPAKTAGGATVSGW